MPDRWSVPRRAGLWQPYDWIAVLALIIAAVFILTGLGWLAAMGVGALGSVTAYVLRRR